MNDQRPVTILLVEDDPGHAVLIEKNLRRAGIENGIVSVGDGQRAMDFLFSEGAFAVDRLPPLLVLLDLNLPVRDGYQVLKAIKSDSRTKHVPVIILTTTDNPQEVGRCYDLGCNAYVTKPVEYDRFSTAIKTIGEFLTIIKVPAKS